MLTVDPLDVGDVLESGGCHEYDLRPSSLEQGVQRYGRADNNPLDPGLEAAQTSHRSDNRVRGMSWGRGDFGHREDVVVHVIGKKVGERAPSVDTHMDVANAGFRQAAFSSKAVNTLGNRSARLPGNGSSG